MASFVIHTASAETMLKGLNLSPEAHALFAAGNLLPDTSFQKTNDNLPDNKKRSIIQHEKIISHFRTDLTCPFQYPDLDYFLSKYSEQVKTDPLIFGIFYHLYIDCKFYRDFIPEFVTTLDANKKPCSNRKEIRYMTVKKINKTVNSDEFFSYHGGLSIYEEYNRLNDYVLSMNIINKNIDTSLNILRTIKINSNIPEINVNEAYNVLLLFKAIISKTHNIPRPLNMFTEESIEAFIKDTAQEFIDTYPDIYNAYK